jgi:hypothetical protein
MELALEPSVYCPSIDATGRYIDKIPSFNSILSQGLRCPCGSRKDKSYNNYNVFYQHCKTQHHQKWLAHLNENRTNHYIECEELKGLVENQKLVIAQMDSDLRNKNMTIDYLTQQLVALNGAAAAAAAKNTNFETANLLDMDMD